jgi:hypothetical protein
MTASLFSSNGVGQPISVRHLDQPEKISTCRACTLALKTHPPINDYMYAPKITRVQDVYGRFYWVDARHLELGNKRMLHICNGNGLRRNYTRAGKDKQNSLCRENVAKVLQTRVIPGINPNGL